MSAPYYAGACGVLYLGDAAEVLPAIPVGAVDLLLTDPPYGVAYVSNRRRESFGPIVGDADAAAVPDLLVDAARRLRRNRHVYVFGPLSDETAQRMGLATTAPLVWSKTGLGLGNLAVPWGPSHEPITFGVRGGRRGGGGLTARLRRGSVLTVPKKAGSAVNRHPTEKPVALLAQLVESSTVPGDTVLDPFAGAGSTLVAAAVLGRRYVGIEIEERYAEVAARRLERAEALAADIAAL